MFVITAYLQSIIWKMFIKENHVHTVHVETEKDCDSTDWKSDSFLTDQNEITDEIMVSDTNLTPCTLSQQESTDSNEDVAPRKPSREKTERIVFRFLEAVLLPKKIPESGPKSRLCASWTPPYTSSRCRRKTREDVTESRFEPVWMTKK